VNLLEFLRKKEINYLMLFSFKIHQSIGIFFLVLLIVINYVIFSFLKQKIL